MPVVPGREVAAALGLAVRVGRGLPVDVDVGVEVGVGVEVPVEREVVLLRGDVLDGGVGLGVGLADRLVVGTVIEGTAEAGDAAADVAVGAGATVVDGGGIGVAVPPAPLQPARVTVRAASAHPNRIRTAAG